MAGKHTIEGNTGSHGRAVSGAATSTGKRAKKNQPNTTDGTGARTGMGIEASADSDEEIDDEMLEEELDEEEDELEEENESSGRRH